MSDPTGDRSHRGWVRRVRRRYPHPGRILAFTVAVTLVVPLCVAAGLYRDGWGAWVYPPLRWLWFAGAFFTTLAGVWLAARGPAPAPAARARRQDRVESAVAGATGACVATALVLDRVDLAVHAAFAFGPLAMLVVTLMRRRPMDPWVVASRVPVSVAMAAASPGAVIAALALGLVWRALHRAPLVHALQGKPSRTEFVAAALRPG